MCKWIPYVKIWMDFDYSLRKYAISKESYEKWRFDVRYSVQKRSAKALSHISSDSCLLKMGISDSKRARNKLSELKSLIFSCFSDSFFTQTFVSVTRHQLSRKTFLLPAWQLCGASQNVIVVTTYWIFANPISFVALARQLPCWESAATKCVLARCCVLGFAVRQLNPVGCR